MSKPSKTKGWPILAAVVIGVGLSSAPAAATLSMMHTYRTGIDVGNDPATGCDFSLGALPDGPLPGFELQVTVVVDTDLMPPQVVSAQVESCSGDGGSFGGAQPLPGFVLQIDSGLLGSDSIVGAIPRSLLGNALVVRLAHYAMSGTGSEDALYTRDGTPDGAAILAAIGGPVPAPLLSGLGIALAVLLLFGIGFTQWRRGRWGGAAMLLMVSVASGAVIAYAAFGEPVAVDDPADAVPPDSRAEIVASFVVTTDGELGLRLDVENIVFVPPAPTNTPTQTPTTTPTQTPTSTACTTVGCPCTPDAPYFAGATHAMPVGPGEGCDAGLVCDCKHAVNIGGGGVTTVCLQQPRCRENHVSEAFEVVYFANQISGYAYPVALGLRDPDQEGIHLFRIVTHPEDGFLELPKNPIPVIVGPPSTISALPAPPIPADVERNCSPRAGGTQCPDCVGVSCPEGDYVHQFILYIPFANTFFGIDSFSYVAVDAFGAESPPVFVAITIFQP